MIIKKIEDYTMLYENDELSDLLMLTLHNPTIGKVQNIAQTVYAKTQGVIYAAYDEASGEAVALLGGSRIDSTHFILKHYVKSDAVTDLKVFRTLIDTIIDDYRFVTLEGECEAEHKAIFIAMGFKVKEIRNHPLDIEAYACERTIKY